MTACAAGEGRRLAVAQTTCSRIHNFSTILIIALLLLITLSPRFLNAMILIHKLLVIILTEIFGMETTTKRHL